MSYKDECMRLAEELAEEIYDKDYYDLTDAQQYEIYTKAMDRWVDRKIA